MAKFRKPHIKKEKYHPKGPSPRIKNPVKPIKKPVITKEGKTIERTYYVLVGKKDKKDIEKENTSKTGKQTPKKKLTLNLKDISNIISRKEKTNTKTIPESQRNKEPNIYDMKNIKEVAENFGINEEALRQFICKI